MLPVPDACDARGYCCDSLAYRASRTSLTADLDASARFAMHHLLAILVKWPQCTCSRVLCVGRKQEAGSSKRPAAGPQPRLCFPQIAPRPALAFCGPCGSLRATGKVHFAAATKVPPDHEASGLHHAMWGALLEHFMVRARLCCSLCLQCHACNSAGLLVISNLKVHMAPGSQHEAAANQSPNNSQQLQPWVAGRSWACC